MVNRIDGSEPYDYTKLKMPAAADRTGGEQFNLAYQRAKEEAGSGDKTGEPEKTGDAGQDSLRTVTQGGVRLELSDHAPGRAAKSADAAAREQTAGTGLLDTVRSWVVSFVQAVKDIFYKIWNDQAAQEETEKLSEEYKAVHEAETETLRKAEASAGQKPPEEGAQREAKIQELLRSGDVERVISLVTDNGLKTMAKNSTLLTYYDRSGRIVPLSASDQERILHGDRNVKEL